MITPAYVAVLYDYHYWANHRLLDAAARLSPDQVDATPLPGLASLRQILIHTLSAEWIWRMRLAGSSPTTMLDPADFPTLASVAARWADEERALRTYTASLSAEDLLRQVAYRTTGGNEWASPIWEILAHLANHGTQHRSEAAAILTALGASPGDLDMVLYFRTR